MKKERWFSGDYKETNLEEIFADITNHSKNKGKIYIETIRFYLSLIERS